MNVILWRYRASWSKASDGFEVSWKVLNRITSACSFLCGSYNMVEKAEEFMHNAINSKQKASRITEAFFKYSCNLFVHILHFSRKVSESLCQQVLRFSTM
jgi:hypothetical protein